MPKQKKSIKELLQQYKETGVLPWSAGRRIEQNDATAVNNANLEAAKMPRMTDYERLLQNLAQKLTYVGLETRESSEVQRLHRLAEQDLIIQRDVARREKNQEAFDKLMGLTMSLTMPSTYISLAIGLKLEGPAALAVDALVFGAAGALKSGFKTAAKSGFKTAVRGVKNAGVENSSPVVTNSINLTKPENNIINSLFEEASIPYEELQMFKNSVLERMADARGITDPVLRKNFILDGMSKVGTKYNKSSILSNPLAEGATNPNTGTITIKPGSEEFALGHEMRHRLDHVRYWNGSENFTLTPEEYGTLRKAYNAEFLDYPAEYPMQVEMVTTNADVRKLLLGKPALRNLSVAQQNAKIDGATGLDILIALRNANDYGRYYYDALMRNPIYRENNSKLMIDALRNIKQALKSVGAFGVPAALSIPQLNK